MSETAVARLPCAEMKHMFGCRFEGEVLQHRANGQHLVAYDDGDEEWLHLSKEKFDLLSSAGGARQTYHKAGQVTAT